jgi:hypothetical protein
VILSDAEQRVFRINSSRRLRNLLLQADNRGPMKFWSSRIASLVSVKRLSLTHHYSPFKAWLGETRADVRHDAGGFP